MSDLKIKNVYNLIIDIIIKYLRINNLFLISNVTQTESKYQNYVRLEIN